MNVLHSTNRKTIVHVILTKSVTTRVTSVQFDPSGTPLVMLLMTARQGCFSRDEASELSDTMVFKTSYFSGKDTVSVWHCVSNAAGAGSLL